MNPLLKSLFGCCRTCDMYNDNDVESNLNWKPRPENGKLRFSGTLIIISTRESSPQSPCRPHTRSCRVPPLGWGLMGWRECRGSVVNLECGRHLEAMVGTRGLRIRGPLPAPLPARQLYTLLLLAERDPQSIHLAKSKLSNKTVNKSISLLYIRFKELIQKKKLRCLLLHAKISHYTSCIKKTLSHTQRCIEALSSWPKRKPSDPASRGKPRVDFDRPWPKSQENLFYGFHLCSSPPQSSVKLSFLMARAQYSKLRSNM